ncbi:MAG: YceI family protein [Mariprofundaceae bacterium]|nr:YceI family protein [Mariprofundaceae bacterium]
MNMKQSIATAVLVLALSLPAQAEKYNIDNFNAHAFIQFKVKHLGFSWLMGRFNTFEGSFEYDVKNPNAANIQVYIDTTSIDSNHAKRDKHLRGKDFLDVAQYPKASFISTSMIEDGENITLHGKFTLHGVSKNIVIQGKHIGAGDDPWGMYRRGFEGHTSIQLSDYNIPDTLGPVSQEVHLYFSLEGIRMK